ncbi:MAG: ABC transporter substrate-binding protein [Betaproteobacteria bacterium]|nr:ABC transporter substrate-binding protein [Betaproteobacteria bacterium]
MMKHSLVLAVAAMAAIPLSTQAQAIKVGIIAPMTGGSADWGVQFQNCIQLFQSQNGDSVAGRKVEVIYRDTGGANPSLAKKHAEELIVNDKVNVLGGFFFSPNAFSVSPVLTQAKIPGVIFVAATPNITQTSPYWVRTGYTSWQSAVPMAQWAYKQGIRRVYIAVQDFAPGHSVQEGFKTAFTRLGGTILGEDRMAMNTTDFAPFVQRIADAKPEAVYMFLSPGPSSIAFLKSIEAAKLKERGIKILGVAETDDQELESVGPVAKGVYSSLHYAVSLPSEMNQSFVKAVVSRFPKDGPPHAGCVGAYDGMRVIYKMIETGKGTIDEKSVEAIKGFSWQSPRGPVSIDPETRDIVQNVYIKVVEEGRDGKLYNKVIETTPAVKDPWKEAQKK